jgi:hypothetical protein
MSCATEAASAWVRRSLGSAADFTEQLRTISEPLQTTRPATFHKILAKITGE